MLAVAVLGIVFASFFAATYERTYAIHSECSDGIDNDGNGLIDYPQDTGCFTPDDDYEGPHLTGNFVSVTDHRDTVRPNDSVVYLINLKQQRDNYRDMNVLLHLPFQANIVSASDGGEVSPGYVRWTNVSVNKNVTRTLQVNVNISPDAQPGQYLLAEAKVPGMTATDTTLVQESVQPQANHYFLSLTDNHEYALPGENLTYTVRVRNDGSQTTVSDLHLALPYETYFISASNNGVRDSYNVTWRSVSLEPGETKTFTAAAQVDYRTTNKMIIRSRAYIGPVSDLDQTVILIGLPYNAITTSITDNRTSAQVGDILTYTVIVKNNSSVPGINVALDASLPHYGEFVSATEGGYWDGKNVRWLGLQVQPNGTRTLQYSVRVRSDTPQGAVMLASVSADGVNGATARDTTGIGTNVAEANQVIFRKTSNSQEAVPGGTIRYTLYVRNTLDRSISDATILDRFENTYLTLESVENQQYVLSSSDGRIEWQVPQLSPGESWQTSYVLAVSKDAPNGMELENIATLRGADLGDISLSQRVRTNKAGVLKEFPTTGVEMDWILALILSFPAAAAAGLQRKLTFGRIFL